MPHRNFRELEARMSPVSFVSSAKIELHKALRSQDVSKEDLARRMGIRKQQVDRLMDLDCNSRVEQLEAAFKALGLRLTLICVDVENK